MNYVLDACAVIALLNGEEGAEIVKDLFEKAEAGEITVYIHSVNLLEVYYDRIRVINLEVAEEFLKKMTTSPVQIIDTIPQPLLREAARFKVTYHPSLADCFALAAAFCYQGTLVTSDHSELEAVEKSEPIPFLWLPPRPKR
jgi:predicted nucleic acid-binding protein